MPRLPGESRDPFFSFWCFAPDVEVSPPTGELLFFARTKKSNQKKVRPRRMVALRLPSSFVAWCHHSTRPIRGRVSLEWSSLTIHASRASFLSILKGGGKAKQEQNGGVGGLGLGAGRFQIYLPITLERSIVLESMV
jgi:hypothetical protein